MDVAHALILALIQGITEFLPISSSAHLILPFEVLGWPDQGLAFDVAVHLGSLLAVMWYFRLDIARLLQAVWHHAARGQSSTDATFAYHLLLASAPLIPAGFFIKELVEGELRSVEVIAATTIIFGVALLVADRMGTGTRNSSELTWPHALAIGIAQCFALIPGTSRSGVTMTMALLAGYTREASARISFLISMPAIGGAATLSLVDLISASMPVDWVSLAIGLAAAGVSAYLCITLFLGVIARIGFLPFVVYRLLLGALLIAFII